MLRCLAQARGAEMEGRAVCECECHGDDGFAAGILLVVALATWMIARAGPRKDDKMGGEAGNSAGGLGLYGKVLVVAALVAAVALVIYAKGARGGGEGGKSAAAPPAPRAAGVPETSAGAAGGGVEGAGGVKGEAPRTARPKMLELGSTTCIPCKMMEGVLAQLRRDYAEKLDIEFIDVTRERSAAARWGIRVIPTQIFLDPQGKELFRHEGFFPKDDIVRKWKELGFDLDR